MSNTPSRTPSRTPSSMPIDTPSETEMDPNLMQIQILQQQLQQQQQQSLIESQRSQAAQQASSAQAQNDIQQKIVNAQTTATSTVWQNISSMNLQKMCLNAKSESNQKNNDVQIINNFSEINVGQMCAAVNNDNIAAGYSIPISSAIIQNKKLTDNDNVIPYCNPSAVSNSKYQKEQCICNQFGPNPVLHNATVKEGGIAGVGATTTTGYYCSPK